MNDWNRFTDEELLEMLRHKANQLGRSPRAKDMEFPTIFCRRFSTWNNALEAAGLNLNQRAKRETASREKIAPKYQRRNVLETDEELVDMYKSFSAKLGHPATADELRSSPEMYDATAYRLRFGSMNNLRKIAGMPITNRGRGRNREHTDKELCNALLRIKQKHGAVGYERLVELLKKEGLPSIITVLTYFRVTSLRLMWEKIEEFEMSQNECASPDCNNQRKWKSQYCSKTCKYREAGRRRRERRKKFDLCVQCGKGHDNTDSKMCSDCYSYFHTRYKKSREER